MTQPFPFPDVATKIGIALASGLLVGLEREWAHKEVGVRTFGIVSLLGALGALIGVEFLVAAFVGVLLLVTFLNIQALKDETKVELTTSAALMATLAVGGLAGQGHYFTASASSIVMTMLLAWKVELAKFAGALKPEEIRSAVLLGLLTFVVYPLLPDQFVDPWELLNPREAWVTVVVIAGIGFFNYVILRLYSTKGLVYAAILGGLVNSTATVAELAALFVGQTTELAETATALLLLTNVAMFVRNVTLLVVFARAAVTTALPAVAVMTLATSVFVWHRQNNDGQPSHQLKLSSPVSFFRVAKFGAVFVLLSIGGTIAQRTFGSIGFLVVSVVGGLVSSASTTATAAALVVAGKISPEMGGIATVLTSITSALVNMPLVYQVTHDKALVGRLTLRSLVVVSLGLVTLGLTVKLHLAS